MYVQCTGDVHIPGIFIINYTFFGTLYFIICVKYVSYVYPQERFKVPSMSWNGPDIGYEYMYVYTTCCYPHVYTNKVLTTHVCLQYNNLGNGNIISAYCLVFVFIHRQHLMLYGKVSPTIGNCLKHTTYCNTHAAYY